LNKGIFNSSLLFTGIESQEKKLEVFDGKKFGKKHKIAGFFTLKSNFSKINLSFRVVRQFG
jgi:hypothetical protein